MIFVTGGTGLIGSHLLFELTKQEEPIRALYRSPNNITKVQQLFKFYAPTNWENQFNKIEWVEGDILDIDSLMQLIPKESYVYHCAALVTFDHKFFNQLLLVNRTGTENVVNCCLEKNVKKLCYVSSTAAIGGNDTFTTEETKWKSDLDISCYSVSKYCAEREVWRGIEEGLNAVIINPCVVLGPGSWKESSLTIFETLKKGSTFYPPGSNATVDARDVAKSMINLMTSSLHSERYLCIGSNQSFKVLMTEITTQLGKKSPSIVAKKWQVNLIRIIMSFIALFTRKRPKINKDTVINLFSTKSYDNSKIRKAIGIEFIPLKEQISNAIAGKYD